ncbi:MAG: HisA/HisF family protein [Archaeoglobaceae archaeon]
MKVFFVLDIRKGIAVHAERGGREKYRPIEEKSLILRTSDPISIVDTLRPRFLYVADLDRIVGEGENLQLIEKLANKVEELIADCGFREAKELEGIKFKPVLATETFDITRIDRKCYVSLDFFDKFVDSSQKFKSFVDAIEFLNTLELEGVIVLNIKRVGTLSVDFELISKAVEVSENPVFVGGGVGSLEDLGKLYEIGCKGVLVATAIHKKKLPLDLIRKGYFRP